MDAFTNGFTSEILRLGCQALGGGGVFEIKFMRDGR